MASECESEWLVHRILSFTLRARATLRRKHALPTSVGFAQARPNCVLKLILLSCYRHGIRGINLIACSYYNGGFSQIW